MRNKRLTLGEDKRICGVCSGLAEYLDMDPTLMRIIWVILFCIYGIGLFPYLVCALIMPKK